MSDLLRILYSPQQEAPREPAAKLQTTLAERVWLDLGVWPEQHEPTTNYTSSYDPLRY